MMITWSLGISVLICWLSLSKVPDVPGTLVVLGPTEPTEDERNIPPPEVFGRVGRGPGVALAMAESLALVAANGRYRLPVPSGPRLVHGVLAASMVLPVEVAHLPAAVRNRAERVMPPRSLVVSLTGRWWR